MAKSALTMLLILSLLLSLAACGRSRTEITVLSREEGSGTRSAFTELSGILSEGKDHTYPRAEVNASTAVMIQTVIYNPSAIGYISLGSLNDSVKALTLEGIYPSTQSVKDGSYPLARTFLLGIREELSPVAMDFLAFLQSDSAQQIIENTGYTPLSSGSYLCLPQTGTVRLAGSSSVAPVMEQLAEAYRLLQPRVTVEIQTSDSSTGLSALASDLCDIAMSSRNLTEHEERMGITALPLCKDGIAVIVSLSNPLKGLTMAQLRSIFTGAVRNWDALP